MDKIEQSIKQLAQGKEQRLPFDVVVDPFYSVANMNRLKESIAKLEAGGGTVHELVEVDDD